jgi:pimeloyl-ACP methyl ester carboxylesterase
LPYATNDGIRIHYRLAGTPDGPPLLLLHGLGGSLHDWDEGYAEPLGATHRLILVDARGHGRSDKPHDPAAYRTALLAADVLAVLDHAGVARAHYYGYSMGGTIGYYLAAHVPQRLRSLIVNGAGATDRESTEGTGPLVARLRQGAEAWTAMFSAFTGGRASPALLAQHRQNDTEAMIAYLALTEPPGIAELLPRVAVPCLIICGTVDDAFAAAQAAAAALPQARFVPLPGADHADDFFEVGRILPHVATFLATVDAQDAPGVPG